jgi:hypothetical protein
MAISFGSIGDPSKCTAGYVVPMTVSVVVANGGRPTGVADSHTSTWRLVGGPSWVRRLAAKVLRRHVTYTYQANVNVAGNAGGTEYFWVTAVPHGERDNESNREGAEGTQGANDHTSES